MPLIDRVREALAPRYRVERELASGGMGIVFHAHDTQLDIPVAIKVIKPELATAGAIERFTREARHLAKLRQHPNVVRIYDAGERAGIRFLVMDFIEGETLADRMSAGAIPIDEALAITMDLLDALEAIHETGVIHRDVKPANMFLVQGRAMLGDFGIAKRPESGGDTVTETGQLIGTPAYMSPEQLTGGEVTLQTDLYSAAAILYEMATGRKWSASESLAGTTLQGVPLNLSVLLLRGLSWSAEERFADAKEFRNAIDKSTRRRVPVAPVVAAAVAIAASVAFYFFFGPGPGAADRRYDIAIEPFTVLPDAGSDRQNLTTYVAHMLQGVSSISVSPHWEEALRQASGPAPDGLATDQLDRFHADRVARVLVTRAGDGTVVDLAVLDGRTGVRRPGDSRRIEVDAWGVLPVGDAIATELIRRLRPDLDSLPVLTENVTALVQFLEAEALFLKNDWPGAQQAAARAVQLDSNFVLAWYRLASAWRWGFLGAPIPSGRRDWIWEHRGGLSPVDQRILEARRLPHGRARIDGLGQTHRDYPLHASAALSYGDELFNRGPLVGIPISQADSILELAIRADSGYGPAYTLLTLVNTQMGERERALAFVNRLHELEAPNDPDISALLGIAVAVRFGLETGQQSSMLQGPDALRTIAFGVRWGLRVDLPNYQLELGRQLAAAPAAASMRASGNVAQGLAWLVLGRPDEAVTQFDIAAHLLGTRDAALHAAELPVALLFIAPEVAPRDMDQVAVRLETLSASDSSGRAAWSRALLGVAEGDEAAVAVWRQRAREADDVGTARRDQLLAAIILGQSGDADAAIQRTNDLIPYNPNKRNGNPFARSLLHILRSAWLERSGRLRAADSALVWYQGQDLVGLPGGSSTGASGAAGDAEVQQGEVDWSMASFARVRRARIALTEGRLEDACRSISRVKEFWAEANPALRRDIENLLAALPEACAP